MRTRMRSHALRRSAIAAITLVIAGTGLVPIRASAQSAPISDALVFQGQVTFTPPIGFFGGSGTFTFSSSLCTLTSDAEPEDATEIPGEIVAPGCAMGATGTYSSLLCTSGSATGVITATTIEGSFTMGVNLSWLNPAGGLITGSVVSSSAPAGDNDTGGTVAGGFTYFAVMGNCLAGITAVNISGNINIMEPASGS